MKLVLPIVLMIAFAATRWPGLMPQNFSAAYGLVFCAGVYFSGKTRWWLPLVTLAATDVALNLYYNDRFGYHLFEPLQLVLLGANYAGYAALIWLGKKFTARASLLSLLGGGILGAIIFYLVSNTASWLFNPFNNPEYTRTLQGWIIALTRGTGGYPETWQFFRNTLLSGGLFTGLFAIAMKLEERSEKKSEVAEEEAEAGEETADKPA